MQADLTREPQNHVTPLALCDALEKHFSFRQFRAGQEDIVRALLAGTDVVAIMPTGAGKSLCFQLPALLLPGVTLVVSPLIALMKDQVDQLTRRGIAATFINSSISFSEQRARLDLLRRGEVRICYVAPERFRSRAFQDALSAIPVALFAVDEAHCISQWGHDFRPDYLKLAPAIARLKRPVVGAFTATATGGVIKDITSGLGLRTPRLFAFGFDRDNLFIRCSTVPTRRDKLPLILKTVARHRTGIVYTATRRAADTFTLDLRAAGIEAQCYHAGLSDDERRSVQDGFMRGKAPVVVATNAFGMGIDKPDVRFVVHHDIPRSFEAYYQEIGRAGRDGQAADCELYFHPSDTAVQRFLIEASHPEFELVRRVYATLRSRRTRAITMANVELKELAGEDAPEASISAALKTLEDADLIERAFGARHAQVVLTPAGNAGARSSRLLAALRSRGADSWIEVDEFALAEAAGIAIMDVAHGLRELDREQCIEYVPATRGRVIHLLDDHDWQDRLAQAHAPLEDRRLRELKRLADMVGFVAEATCRRHTILRYFTGRSPAGPCHRCDRCAEPMPMVARERSPERIGVEDTIVKKILSAVGRMQDQYGKQKIVQVLHGSSSQELPEHLRRLSVYGILAAQPQKTTAAALDELVALGAVAKSKGEYPTLSLTRLGREVVHGRMAMQLQSLAVTTRRAAPALEQARNPVDLVLLDRLRLWRAEVADAAGQPRYTVFHDRTLAAIASERPRSAEAFVHVHGVGPTKVERYWPAIRALVDAREAEILAAVGKRDAQVGNEVDTGEAAAL